MPQSRQALFPGLRVARYGSAASAAGASVRHSQVPRIELARPPGTDWARYAPALDGVLARIADEAPGALVVSLGVDTWDGDPICSFALQTADYRHLGRRIGGLGLPTVIVMEGGYAVASLGDNVAEFLGGFAEA